MGEDDKHYVPPPGIWDYEAWGRPNEAKRREIERYAQRRVNQEAAMLKAINDLALIACDLAHKLDDIELVRAADTLRRISYTKMGLDKQGGA